MSKTTSFALGEKYEAFLKQEVSEGNYSNASEVVRDALRRMMEYKRKRAEWERLIDEGVSSAETEPLLSVDQVWKSLAAQRRARKRKAGAE